MEQERRNYELGVEITQRGELAGFIQVLAWSQEGGGGSCSCQKVLTIGFQF